MSDAMTQHTRTNVRDRVTGAWATVEAAALAQANVLDSHYGGQPAKAAEIRNAVEQVAAILRTPRGEGDGDALGMLQASVDEYLWEAQNNPQFDAEAAFAALSREIRAALRSEAQGDGPVGAVCANCGAHNAAIAGGELDPDEAVCSVECYEQLMELGCPQAHGGDYRPKPALRSGARGSEASAPYAYIGVEETWDVDSRSVTVHQRVLWDRDSATRWQAERPEDRTVTPVYHRPAARRGEGGGE